MAREFYVFAPDLVQPAAVYRIDDRRDVAVFDLEASAYRPADRFVEWDVRRAIYGNGELAFTKVDAGEAETANRLLARRLETTAPP